MAGNTCERHLPFPPQGTWFAKRRIEILSIDYLMVLSVLKTSTRAVRTSTNTERKQNRYVLDGVIGLFFLRAFPTSIICRVNYEK